jgi:hypothetical protein
MKIIIAFFFSLGVVAGAYAAGGEPAAFGDDQRSSSLRQTSSTPPPAGALVQLVRTYQPPIIGNFSFGFANGPNTSVITPDMKYMYVLVNTAQIGQNNTLTPGSNKILTYPINSDGTLSPIGNPQAGQDTTGTSLYIANQGQTLLTVNTDESDPTATTAPFEVFVIHADGSLLLVPNTINMPAPQNIPSFAAIGPQAVAGSGQYFYVASIDNDPNDGMYYMTSGAVYGYEIASEGRFTTAGSAVASAFFLPQPTAILNILANDEFLYVFGESGAYITPIVTSGVDKNSSFMPYNDDNFFDDAFYGMQISTGGQNFYAVDSPNGDLSSLGICHYSISSNGAIQFTSKECQNVLNNVPSGESFGASGMYITPDNKFLYGLFEDEVGPTCSASIYAYAINNDGSLSPLNFTSASPANSLPTGNNFCSDAFIAGAPDGNYVYAFGVEDQANVILPFRINKGLAARDLK